VQGRQHGVADTNVCDSWQWAYENPLPVLATVDDVMHVVCAGGMCSRRTATGSPVVLDFSKAKPLGVHLL
jgi:hypothetical protein